MPKEPCGTSSRLQVLEYPYCYGAWRLDPADHSRVTAEKVTFSGRRSVEDYRLCGVYGKMGCPYTIEEITGDETPELELWQSVPLGFAKACERAAREGKKILVSSGYCAFAPAILGGLQRALGPEKTVGVVWMDAHCDNLIVEQTQRTDLRFVSFPLSVIAGQTMEKWRKEACLLERPCSGETILVGDGHCSGPEGLENLQRAGIVRAAPQAFACAEQWDEKVEQLAQRVDAIFLMVDVDILQSRYIPAYFRREPGGHTMETVTRNIASVMKTGKVAAFACFCVDFDKYDQGGDVTYLNGMRLIGTALEAWE